MANWTLINVTDLDDYMPAGLSTKARTVALAAGQGDPFDDLMPTAVAKVRAAVASCRANKVDADVLKVPNSLKDVAVLLIAERLFNRVSETPTENQEKQFENARKTLEKVAECDIAIETPDDPIDAPTQRTGGVEFTNPRTRKYNHDKLKRL